MDIVDNGPSAGKRKFTDSSRLSAETKRTHNKRRSHSRGNSITNFDDILGLPTSAIPSPPRSRPTSHHRRRSSVSTRRESAEVMGFSAQDDAATAAASKESITSSRVDSHLRALFALEGRTSPGSSPLATTSFAKVDLPDFGADTDKLSDSTAAFAHSSSSSANANAKPHSTSFSTNNSLAGKRDSFGKLLAPVAVGTKKELQTLLEEDEGEDSDSETGAVPVPATRHRPRSLNLRSSLILRSQSASTLPTPSPTPSTARTPKLKSLTLAASSGVQSSPNALQLSAPKRSSTLVISSSVPLLSAAELEMTHRQSSISYRKPSSLIQQHAISDAALSSLFLGLPPTMNNIGGSSTTSSPAHSPRSKTLTPTMSPTMGRRSVSGSGSYSGTSMGSPTPSRRSKSPTELLVTQSSYLAQSHASLLARISELEAALLRATSASPALTTSEPSEELLEMLSDLKAERDQLKRSLNVLTERFGELEKTLTSLGRKLDHEKREAWVSKEKLRVKEEEMNVLTNEKEILQEEVEELRSLLGSARAAAREEKDKRVEVERELHAALETNRVTAVPYPYPTHYGRGPRGSLDSQLTTSEVAGFNIQSDRRDVHAITGNDETSFHSRSPSSASFSSGPMTHQVQGAIPTGWSFAKAAMRAKERSKPAVDPFLAALEDDDEPEFVSRAPTSSVKLSPGALKPNSPLSPARIINSPGPFTSSSGLSSSGASGVLSSPGAYSIGFGFGLSGDEDEDSTFNFGQQTSPSPFPKSDESSNDGSDDDDKGADEINTVPLVDDEDATFTFASQASEDSHASSSNTMHLPTLASRPSSSVQNYSLPSTPSMPKFSDPATPRVRHKAKDSISVRRRHMEKASVDLNGASSLEGVRRSTMSPSRTSEDSVASSPRSEPSYFVPRSPPPSSAKPQRFSLLVAPTLDISIPSSDFGSFLPSFEKLQAAILPPPPPPAMRPPVTSSRSPPPIPPPSPARRSGSREMSLSNVRGKETVGSSSAASASTSAPTHAASRSSISLSLASLASLLPVSWSPRASPTSPTTSLGGRSSMERAFVSREKQLNRLAERMGSQGSISSLTNGERSQSPLATATSQIDL
ncbi:hypothetical protein FS842_006543 [Serendipita sp. 407]|nr:hypothetical protein FS842_006543 [Serendipita sp. 407]